MLTSLSSLRERERERERERDIDFFFKKILFLLLSARVHVNSICSTFSSSESVISFIISACKAKTNKQIDK